MCKFSKPNHNFSLLSRRAGFFASRHKVWLDNKITIKAFLPINFLRQIYHSIDSGTESKHYLLVVIRQQVFEKITDFAGAGIFYSKTHFSNVSSGEMLKRGVHHIKIQEKVSAG